MSDLLLHKWWPVAGPAQQQIDRRPTKKHLSQTPGQCLMNTTMSLLRYMYPHALLHHVTEKLKILLEKMTVVGVKENV